MSNHKVKFKHIWVNMFGANIYYVKCIRKDYDALIKREFKLVAPEKADNVLGTCDEYTRDNAEGRSIKTFAVIQVIWINSKLKGASLYPCLAHEVFHAVHNICREKGVWLTDSSEETYAYMINWIMLEVIRLEKKGTDYGYRV